TRSYRVGRFGFGSAGTLGLRAGFASAFAFIVRRRFGFSAGASTTIPPWPRTPSQRQPAGGWGWWRSAGFSPCLKTMVEARLRADAASPGVQPFAVVLASRARTLWMRFVAVVVVIGDAPCSCCR